MRDPQDVVIVSAVRTPFGKFGGALKDIPSLQLGAHVMRAALDRAGVADREINEVYYGTCMPAETALELNIPARQALLKAGLPPETLSLTIDRACCSSATAVQLGTRAIRSGEVNAVLAVGAENMSRVPLLLPGARFSYRLGHMQLVDPLFGLKYPDWTPVSVDAGEVAMEEGIGRAEQDEWALRSQHLYQAAKQAGFFAHEIIPVEVPQPRGAAVVLQEDEFPRPGTSLERLAQLPTVYGSPTVTPGNAPGMDTGAAAILLMRRSYADQLGVVPLGRVVATASVAADARLLAKVPGWAIQAALRRAGLALEAMDRVEINEAFAAVPLVSSQILAGDDPARLSAIRGRLNVNGGAVAIGHPVGASGARLIMTLLYELRRSGGRYGVAAICGGLAQGDAVIIEADR